MLRHSLKVGFSFGVTSSLITTLGLMVGLYSGTNSRTAVIGGILMIAVADAFSDALGIHVSEETENAHTEKQIWVSTISTFLSKLLLPLTFIVPVLALELKAAIITAVAWGMLILAVLSYAIAREQKVSPWRAVAEHLVIAVIVIIATHYLGNWVSSRFY